MIVRAKRRATHLRGIFRFAFGLLGGCLLAAAAWGAPGGTIFWQGAASAPFLAAPSQPLLQRAQPGGLLARQRGPMFGARPPALLDAPAAPGRSMPDFFDVPDAVVAHLINNPPRDFVGVGELGCIAVSIYHEARNQPPEGQYAVGSVILNRAHNPERWGNTPCAVVLEPVQFSYLTPDRRFAPIREPRAWELAVRIAAQVMKNGPAPALKGADHYHATYVAPVWNKAMTPIGRIADHIFWRSRPRPEASRQK